VQLPLLPVVARGLPQPGAGGRLRVGGREGDRGLRHHRGKASRELCLEPSTLHVSLVCFQGKTNCLTAPMYDPGQPRTVRRMADLVWNRLGELQRG
jgi:hypothetical protein